MVALTRLFKHAMVLCWPGRKKTPRGATWQRRRPSCSTISPASSAGPACGLTLPWCLSADLRTGGTVLALHEPAAPCVRVDSGLTTGMTVTSSYDPMLAKIIAWGPDRGSAFSWRAGAWHAWTCPRLRGCEW